MIVAERPSTARVETASVRRRSDPREGSGSGSSFVSTLALTAAPGATGSTPVMSGSVSLVPPRLGA